MVKVVIIEDDEAILEVINNILMGQDYQTFCPKTESAIYSLARKEKPSFILLDLWLAGLDGIKIAQNLKDDERTQKIPLIIMSANTETEKISQAVKADGFLLKPFTIEELLATAKRFTE